MSLIDRSRCIARQCGTAVGYRYYGCRCRECREAHRVHANTYREQRLPPALVDAARTQRRIRALLASGWTGPDIARAAGWDSRRRVHHLLARHQIRPRTVDLIDRVYAELGTSPERSDVGRARCRWDRAPRARDVDNDPAQRMLREVE